MKKYRLYFPFSFYKQSWIYFFLNPNPLTLFYLFFRISNENYFCFFDLSFWSASNFFFLSFDQDSSGKFLFLFLLFSLNISWYSSDAKLQPLFFISIRISRYPSHQFLYFSGSLLPNEIFFFLLRGYILLRKVSSHDSQNLCTRFVTSVQYEELLFYLTIDTFVPFFPGTLSYWCIRSFLQETQLLSLHIDEFRLSFQRNHLNPFFGVIS